LQVPTGGTMKMDGQAIWNFATEKLPETVRALCRAADVPLGDVQRIVAHQSNRNIIAEAASRLQVPLDRFPINLDRLGNTVAASIPLALHESCQQSPCEAGELLALVGYGGGLAWGGQLWRM
jgi:3-oxoacyl-[acyl-carrier-protein] synthase-3